MEKRATILMSAVLVLSACGTAAQYSSSGQRFQDGIYVTRTDTAHERQVAAADEKEL